MNKDLQIGQRVRLSDDHSWERNEANPTHCEGTIVDAEDVGHSGWVCVDWDNGRGNTYIPDSDDLIPVEATSDSALETLV